MRISIRDVHVRIPEFDSPAAGMKRLALEDFEATLDNEWRVCAMRSGELVPVAAEEQAAQWRAELDTLGLRACALRTARDFSVDNASAHVEWLARAVRVAEIAGAGALVIDSAMSREKELPFEERVAVFVEVLGEVLARTENSNVAMGIENHGAQGNNLAFLLSVIQQVGSPRLGMTLDTANFYWRGIPLSEVHGILRLLAPHARHVHIKNINYPEAERERLRETGWEYRTYAGPLEEGNIDLPRVVAWLREVGYGGSLCVEAEYLRRFDTAHQKIAALERDVAYARKLAGA